ncbi:hypothetical protein FISHEDRAFT_60030 [Fistulina hepatica ATCC 64428]|uniref:Uncharacterized protein n=1 Tax=Fistulina hepatica ATCC 64428 TaxID=1128425 RepID=A0A0D7AAB8_9AGAR|nr:hypothetical protein FISHEDRAFT_60030 [Fistulina hepatica ATCC 64428]
MFTQVDYLDAIPISLLNIHSDEGSSKSEEEAEDSSISSSSVDSSTLEDSATSQNSRTSSPNSSTVALPFSAAEDISSELSSPASSTSEGTVTSLASEPIPTVTADTASDSSSALSRERSNPKVHFAPLPAPKRSAAAKRRPRLGIATRSLLMQKRREVHHHHHQQAEAEVEVDAEECVTTIRVYHGSAPTPKWTDEDFINAPRMMGQILRETYKRADLGKQVADYTASDADDTFMTISRVFRGAGKKIFRKVSTTDLAFDAHRKGGAGSSRHHGARARSGSRPLPAHIEEHIEEQEETLAPPPAMHEPDSSDRSDSPAPQPESPPPRCESPLAIECLDEPPLTTGTGRVWMEEVSPRFR